MNKNSLKSLIIRSNLLVNCRRTNVYQLFPEESRQSVATTSPSALPSEAKTIIFKHFINSSNNYLTRLIAKRSVTSVRVPTLCVHNRMLSTQPSTPEKVWTLPNILCMARIGCTPIIGYLVVNNQFSIALTLCAIGSVTDLLDGYIARKYDCVTRLGAILDPMADKLLVATLVITLTAVHLIPIWLTGLILLRDSLIITGALYLIKKRLTPPKTMARLIAMSTEMSQQFRPTLISKINTGFQLSLVAITLSAPVFGFTDHWFLTGLQLATGLTTLSSGLIYLKRLRPDLT